MIQQDWPLHALWQVTDGVDVRVEQTQRLRCVPELVPLGHWNHPPQARGRASFQQDFNMAPAQVETQSPDIHMDFDGNRRHRH